MLKAIGREAKLSYMGHVAMENRLGLAVAGTVSEANGTAERRASETMLAAKSKTAGHRITVGEDKAYDTADHVANLRAVNVTPHMTQNNGVTRPSAYSKSCVVIIGASSLEHLRHNLTAVTEGSAANRCPDCNRRCSPEGPTEMATLFLRGLGFAMNLAVIDRDRHADHRKRCRSRGRARQRLSSRLPCNLRGWD